MRKLFGQQRGFTLLEILLVVAAIGILAGIVIIAINPGKQLGDTRNAQRRVDVNTILNAVYQYSLDNNGAVPGTITNTDTGICLDAGACSSLIILSSDLVPDYIVSMPVDPKTTATAGATTGYTISKNAATFRITVSAPAAENNATISVTR
ncbi:MAG: hypothetical protein COU81_00115 [Candidatus Portnoybacteria bacterium CG10_big_fil_rev_8_21_14_0_10_36_7]|uniref:Type II secretion system protein GspG C-terminal domain-containing protein n=1 Tax=Candidatus Portnoybacteria bacterium CG10_big_fil_rev_8_21_14_0_10_36_7 TaxID=1974812 RepID=A0A2M8KF63_9BACT|nr:MAG: hypothetical protein COU81_00115 [Candidatus Portnoybacteria bacterium CG10_big_fil_rev_8_21_14_0_10_36_7]